MTSHNTRKTQDLSRPSQDVRITGEQIRTFCVKQGTAIVHLLEGRAWITVDNNDLIAEQGETIHIPASKHTVIISPANRTSSIQFQVT